MNKEFWSICLLLIPLHSIMFCRPTECKRKDHSLSRLSPLRTLTKHSVLQVDELKDALSVLELLPISAQRCQIATYTQLVGACFRAGLGDEAMRLIKEYVQHAPADRGPSLSFFVYCMKGFRQLKSPGFCAEIQVCVLRRACLCVCILIFACCCTCMRTCSRARDTIRVHLACVYACAPVRQAGNGNFKEFVS